MKTTAGSPCEVVALRNQGEQGQTRIMTGSLCVSEDDE